jgi:hypothetical protein
MQQCRRRFFQGTFQLRYIIHMMLNRPFQALRFRVSGREILRRAAIAVLLLAGVRAHAQATWSPIVRVGPGYVDCFARQVVRTSSDVVYVITNASGFSGGTLPSSIRVYKGSPAGNPTSFAEVDAAHRPSNGVRMGGVEAKLPEVIALFKSSTKTSALRRPSTSNSIRSPIPGALLRSSAR